MHPYKKILLKLEEEHLLRSLIQIDSEAAASVSYQGQELLLFCSNNYLGLANHAKLREAAFSAIQTWGVGTGAARLVSGNISLYTQLEEHLARFKHTESAIVFSTGYMANIGAISAIAQKGDLILADRLNHASLIDGSRFSRATFRVYRHKDMAHLEKLLKNRNKGRQTLIVTDSIFSMDGDIAPLPEILRLAEDYDTMVYLDDAHATGVLGMNGKGAAEHFHVSSPRLIQMGTLSKALGGFGGFIAGPHDLIQYLMNKARPFIYTTALPPSTLASALAALTLIEDEPLLIKRLWENRNYLHQKLSKLGFNTLGSETPILPILIGESKKTLAFSQRLMENGLLVSAIRPPTVPRATARLRITVMATHTQEQMDVLLHHMETIGKEMRII